MVEGEERILEELQEENPWWVGSEKAPEIEVCPELPSFRRADFYHYSKELDTPSVHLLIGPRRVGKTTLMQQLVSFLLNEKQVDPRRILFASLDRTSFELSDEKLVAAISIFERRVLKKRISESDGMVYLFIDEAQYDPLWGRVMKKYVDQKQPIFALVSGSSSTALFKDRESGAGRFRSSQMVTLKFRDVLRFKFPEYKDQIRSISLELRDLFRESCRLKELGPYADAVEELSLSVPPYLATSILGGQDDYILRGGYPDFYAHEPNWREISKRYQQDVFDVILQKDIVNSFPIRYPQKLRKLMVIIAQNTARPLSREVLGEKLNISTKTLDQYVLALQKTFLASVSSRFSTRRYPSTKKKKYYATDTGLRNSILGVENLSNPHERGQLLETAVFNHAMRLCFHMDHRIRSEGNYYSDAEEERDIVLDLRNSHDMTLPIEVKNGQCSPGDVAKIRRTMNKVKAPFGLVVCDGGFRREGSVLALPSWAFLLTC